MEQISTLLLVSAPFFLLFAVYAVFIIGCSSGFPDASATPEQGFWVLFKQEMPDSVANIECHGAFWMDHSVSVRFQVDAAEIDSLTAGYQPIEWTEVNSQFESPPYREEFDGRWLAIEIAEKSCYSQTQIYEGGATDNYLVIDRKQNTVYGISRGSVGSTGQTPVGEQGDSEGDESEFSDTF